MPNSFTFEPEMSNVRSWPPIPNGVAGAIGGIVVCVLLWCVSTGLLLYEINKAKRCAVIDVVGDTLLITRVALFGSQLFELQANQIESIEMRPSGSEVNNQPVMELQIHPRNGETIGLLSYRHDDELEWMTCVLCEALGLRHNHST